LPTLRVVLDTNVLVSGIVYPETIPGRIYRAWEQGAIKVVLSRYILDELARTLPRFEGKLLWQPSDYTDLDEILTLRAEMVEPRPLDRNTVRDPSDVLILGTLLASKADYLVTGDKDLLALSDRHPTIISPADFWRKHGA
jgi:putative PIN family toxin of toxin-antitoxin system